MKLVLAEKPDQGAKLAAPFRSQKRNGYIELEANELFPKGAYMSWAIGHLCELVPPENYDPKWKKWSMETLPIIPERFQHQVVKSKWKQFKVIQELIHRPEVTEVIIAGDAGREGEAIIRIILSLCKNQKRIKRLWISSLTTNAVVRGFENLLAEHETRNLYYEALSRAYADWLVGMNTSRAYTLLLKKKGIASVFSLGRVQTPTLALVVKREKEIEQFKPEAYWEVKAKFLMNEKSYEGTWVKDNQSKIQTNELADKIAKFCIGKEARIQSINKERKQFAPPFLFNLSSLQATANKRFKYSPKKTLDIAQKLYVKGIISYPRSDSSYITKEEAKTLPSILEKLSHYDEFKAFFPLPIKSIMENKRYVNEKNVTDHYAIIPTEQVTDPKKLSAEEKNIYELIVQRVIAAHYEKAIIDYTTIHTLVAERAEFLSKGKEQIQEGWRKVIFPDKSNLSKEEETEQLLPALAENEQGIVANVNVLEKKTQAPKRFTEGDLITLMKTAGKYLEDEELIKVLKHTEGLGTEATRAGIIGVLKDRKYIEVVKNQVFATEKGKLLIEAVGESILASPEMTAKWEQRLSEIGEGKASPTAFMEQVKKLTIKLINDATKESNAWNFSHLQLEEIKESSYRGNKKQVLKGKCPICSGAVVDKGSFFGCSNYAKTKCSFSISKRILGKSISVTNIEKILEKGKSNLIKGFKKAEQPFDAYLVWNHQEKKLKFVYK